MTRRNLASKCIFTAAAIFFFWAGGAVGQEKQVAQNEPAKAIVPTETVKANGAPAPVGDNAPLVVRIESAGPITLHSESEPSGLGHWLPIVAPYITGLLALGGAWLGVLWGGRNTKKTVEAMERTNRLTVDATRAANEATVWQKANEAELRDIQGRLDGFYGPFRLLTEMNKNIANEFRDRQPNREQFVLLVKLFDRGWKENLSAGDKKLLEEICSSNAQALQKLVTDAAKMVDPKLRPYLSRVAVHFRILRLAYDGMLGDDSTHFLKYLYPYQINKVLELEINRLIDRCDVLRAHPDQSPGPMKALEIPDDHDHRLPDWPEPPILPIGLGKNPSG